jgi:O-antigen ligase
LALFFFLERCLKVKLIQLAGFMLVGSLFFPGVRETIKDQLSTIVMSDTAEGASAEYRKILWEVATGELSKGAFRFGFGYGPMATAVTDIQSYFEKNRGALPYLDTGGASWDSEYAANLFQYGFLGFSLFVLLGIRPFWIVAQNYKHLDSVELVCLAQAVAIMIVYHWSMTTVAIFSPQIKYIFWCAVAVALNTVLHQNLEDWPALKSQENCPDLKPEQSGIKYAS